MHAHANNLCIHITRITKKQIKTETTTAEVHLMISTTHRLVINSWILICFLCQFLFVENSFGWFKNCISNCVCSSCPCNSICTYEVLAVWRKRNIAVIFSNFEFPSIFHMHRTTYNRSSGEFDWLSFRLNRFIPLKLWMPRKLPGFHRKKTNHSDWNNHSIDDRYLIWAFINSSNAT